MLMHPVWGLVFSVQGSVCVAEPPPSKVIKDLGNLEPGLPHHGT